MKKNNLYYYSIIIPHYNSSILVGRLLNSIPNVDTFQTIVVDDNSCAEEFKTLQKLQEKYSFELYKNEYRTAGGARNTGMKYAKADWLIFADADDYFEEGMDKIVDKYLNTDYDIVYFNVNSKYNDGTLAYRNEHIRNISMKALHSDDMNYLRYCYTAPWGKLIKRKLVEIHNIKFDEVVAANDMWFSITTGFYANKVAYDQTPLYCVTVTKNSITTILSKDRFESRFQVTLKVNDFLRKNNLSKYQISILYFLGKAYQFGVAYQVHVIIECIKHKSNPLIGIKKLLSINSVLKDRQNVNVK